MSRKRYPDDLTGMKFGRLTVISKSKSFSGKQRKCRCLCQCGKEVDVIVGNLFSSNTKSCGCYNVDVNRLKSTKHGKRNSRIYTLWHDMLRRCNNPKNSGYYKYGAKGIKVCKRWEKFENFYADMGESYEAHVKEFGEKNTTIERINISNGYNPKNCKWATLLEQANNKSNNFFITLNGVKKSLSQWSREVGLKSGTIRLRILKGWSPEKAFNTPIFRPKL